MITLDSDPKLNAVNIGASILRLLVKSDYVENEIDSLYVRIKNEYGASYEVFVYTLDWLYIIGAIDLSEQGKITHATQ